MSETKDTFIGRDHPHDGRRWDCQCARCGSELAWEECSACEGEGMTAPGQLYEEDPLWYDPDDAEPCHQCGGEAAFPSCMSSPAWCEAHPIIGREGIARSTPEWFVIQHE